MSHFARVVDGIVVEVLVADQDFIDIYSQSIGGQWVQTSYNTRGGIHYQPNSNVPSEDQSKALRKNYAGIGMIYDASLDAFYDPQPFPSWTLDTATCLWQPPTPRPDDRNLYNWDEPTLSWVMTYMWNDETKNLTEISSN